MNHVYTTTFKGNPFRFVTVPGRQGETFIVQSDLIDAFCAAMPRLPRAIHEQVIRGGSRECFGPAERQRAYVDNAIVPVINLNTVISMVQGLNAAIREDKRFRKASKGFTEFQVFFAQSIGKAQDALGTVPFWNTLGFKPSAQS